MAEQTMVGRVINAIGGYLNDRCDPREVARAAIEAMREPTEHMLVALEVAPELEGIHTDHEHIRHGWEIMIDAALKE